MAELDMVYARALNERGLPSKAWLPPDDAGTRLLREHGVVAAEHRQHQSFVIETAKLLLWAWFAANLDRSIKLRLWKFGVSIAVHRLRGLFELLAGPPPDAIEPR